MDTAAGGASRRVLCWSAYYLFPDWAQLQASQKRYAELANQPNPAVTDLMIAAAAENRHRINCFAEGVGVLLGSTILAIGIRGLAALPDPLSLTSPAPCSGAYWLRTRARRFATGS